MVNLHLYEFINGFLIIVFAAAAAAFDIKYRRIPNMLVLGMTGIWLLMFICKLIMNTDAAAAGLTDCIFGLLAGGGIFLAVYLASRKGLGGGDVKFMAIAGLYLGLSGTLTATLISSILAALTGLTLIVLKKITRKDKLPLAPFLLAGIVITVIF